MTGSRNFLLALAAVVIAPFVLVLLPGGSPDAPHLAAATVSTAVPHAQNAISAEDAAEHAGDFATVEGFVRNVHTARSGSATFIDLDGVYPDSPFSAVIFAGDFEDVGDVHNLVGRTVAITGEIRMYRNRPEIVVSSRNQIVAH
jgi:hypothetical protein